MSVILGFQQLIFSRILHKNERQVEVTQDGKGSNLLC